MSPAEEFFLENVETPRGEFHLFSLKLSAPTDAKRSKLKHHRSKPPSVSQHRAITRVHCSCPTRNLPARKPCVTVLATLALSFVVIWTIRNYRQPQGLSVRTPGCIKVRLVSIVTREHHAAVTLFRFAY